MTVQITKNFRLNYDINYQSVTLLHSVSLDENKNFFVSARNWPRQHFFRLLLPTVIRLVSICGFLALPPNVQ